MITAGTFPATVQKTWLGTSGSGTLFVGIQFKVDNFEDDLINSYVYLSDKSLKIGMRQLIALGWTKDSNLNDLHQDEDPSKSPLFGKKTSIEIEEQEFNGKRSMRVVNIGPRTDKPDASKVETLNKKLKALFGKKSGPAVPKLTPAEEAEMNQKAEEEGIPF